MTRIRAHEIGTTIADELAILNSLAGIPIVLAPMIRADFEGTPRNYGVAVALGSKIYLGTGNDNTYTKDWWEYDPATGLWTQKTDFGGVARDQAIAAAVGSKIYLGTGYNGYYLKDWWEYDPATDTWTQKTDFGGSARSAAVAAALGSKIYVGTGMDGAYKKDWFLQNWNY